METICVSATHDSDRVRKDTTLANISSTGAVTRSVNHVLDEVRRRSSMQHGSSDAAMEIRWQRRKMPTALRK